MMRMDLLPHSSGRSHPVALGRCLRSSSSDLGPAGPSTSMDSCSLPAMLLHLNLADGPSSSRGWWPSLFL